MKLESLINDKEHYETRRNLVLLEEANIKY